MIILNVNVAGNNQRQEYTSQMPLAALTGPPIITPAPMNTQPQAIANVQIPQLQQAPHHYQVSNFSHSLMHLIFLI